MPGNKRPSFLKRQKEQKRIARAAEKREARRLRKRTGSSGIEEPVEPDMAPGELEGSEEAMPSDTGGKG